MVVKVRKNLKKIDMLKITTNLKSIIHEDKEMQDIMIEFYPNKRNLMNLLESIFRIKILQKLSRPIF